MEEVNHFPVALSFPLAMTRPSGQSSQPPAGIVELDGEKFTLQW